MPFSDIRLIPAVKPTAPGAGPPWQWHRRCEAHELHAMFSYIRDLVRSESWGIREI